MRVLASGLAWDVLLATDDAYLDRYTIPMSNKLSADELGRWRRRIQDAWEVLVRQHRWAAGPIADGASVIVPLTPQSETDLISATSPAAFGAVATSWPPDRVTMAETLVHEFQHVKLCGLLDMVPLASSGRRAGLRPLATGSAARCRPPPRNLRSPRHRPFLAGAATSRNRPG